MSREIEIKSCPFCGGEAMFLNKFTNGKLCKIITCPCDVLFGSIDCDTEDQITKRWNTRKPCEVSEEEIAFVCYASLDAHNSKERAKKDWNMESPAVLREFRGYGKAIINHLQKGK